MVKVDSRIYAIKWESISPADQHNLDYIYNIIHGQQKVKVNLYLTQIK